MTLKLCRLFLLKQMQNAKWTVWLFFYFPWNRLLLRFVDCGDSPHWATVLLLVLSFLVIHALCHMADSVFFCNRPVLSAPAFPDPMHFYPLSSPAVLECYKRSKTDKICVTFITGSIVMLHLQSDQPLFSLLQQYACLNISRLKCLTFCLKTPPFWFNLSYIIVTLIISVLTKMKAW